MLIHHVLIFFAFLIDGILNVLFPTIFGFSSMYFVPCFGFCALVLTCRKLEIIDSIIMSILWGLFYDFFYTNTLFLYTFIFTIIIIVTRLWTKRINDSAFENLVLCISTLFVREVMVYLFMKWTHQSALDFNTWLINRMFLTLLINGILTVALVFISYVKDDYLKRKEIRIRREERLPWMR